MFNDATDALRECEGGGTWDAIYELHEIQRTRKDERLIAMLTAHDWRGETSRTLDEVAELIGLEANDVKLG